jgi:hypothetical protein
MAFFQYFVTDTQLLMVLDNGGSTTKPGLRRRR